MYSKKDVVFIACIILCIFLTLWVISGNMGKEVKKSYNKIFVSLKKVEKSLYDLEQLFCFFNFPEEDNNLELKNIKAKEAVYLDRDKGVLETHKVLFEKGCQISAIEVDRENKNSLDIYVYDNKRKIFFLDNFSINSYILVDDFYFLKRQIPLIYLPIVENVFIFDIFDKKISGIVFKKNDNKKNFIIFIEEKIFLFSKEEDFLEILDIFIDKDILEKILKDFERNTFSPSVPDWEKKYNNPKIFGLRKI